MVTKSHAHENRWSTIPPSTLCGGEGCGDAYEDYQIYTVSGTLSRDIFYYLRLEDSLSDTWHGGYLDVFRNDAYIGNLRRDTLYLHKS